MNQRQDPSFSLLYSRPEAAYRGGFSLRQLDRLVERREVPFKRVGRRVLFPKAQFDEWCVSVSLAFRLGGVN
jgi:excisionase family DNA binding protein